MAAILLNLRNTVISGFVLVVVVALVLVGWHKQGLAFDHNWWAFLFRWLHVLSGVMWIGMLWYFNFVQTPSMPKIDAAHRILDQLRALRSPARQIPETQRAR